MIDIELLIDIVIILLLIPAIFYSCRLNRNLNILRNNQNCLPQLIQTLNEATTKAESAVAGLKNAGMASAAELKAAADSARTAKDELAFICEKAENLSDLLENTIYASRTAAENGLTAAKTERAEAEDAISALPENFPHLEMPEEPSEAENELLQALRSIK